MKASELIVRLCDLMKQHGGDLDVMLDTNPYSLARIEDVGIDCEQDVIVIFEGGLVDEDVAGESKVFMLAPGEMDARD